jgi:acetyltransferase-like isoleucine patch superfamily enzyme
MSWRRLPSRVEDKLDQLVSGLRGRWRLRGQRVELSRGAKIMGVPVVTRCEGSRIAIGEDVVLCSRSRWTALGVAHPVVLRTLRPGATLRIGRGTGISGGSICAAVSVTIGERCLIGADVTIVDTDFHALDPARRETGWDDVGCAPVHIGDDVFIGTRALILKGVRIGDGAVVGAGAVVTRSVPARAVVAGNPAQIVRGVVAATAAVTGDALAGVSGR